MNNIYGLNISQWYGSLLGVLSTELVDIAKGSTIGTILVIYPLYVFYVYLLDLVLDVFVFIPKLFHNFIKRFGGEKY